MIFDKTILDSLAIQAKVNPRLRQALDLRNSSEDGSQRMLNALEPGTIMPIHRHHGSSETVIILRGKIQWMFYDESGNETDRVLLRRSLRRSGDVSDPSLIKGLKYPVRNKSH